MRTQPSAARPKKGLRRRLLLGLSVLAGLFVLANACAWAYYHNRAYPRTTMGTVAIGNLPYSAILAKATQENVLPAELTLVQGDKRAVIKTKSAGLSIDSERAKTGLNNSRSWLPIANLFTRHAIPAPVAIDRDAMNRQAQDVRNALYSAPVDAQIELKNNTFTTIPGRDGAELDKAKLAAAILQALDAGNTTISVPITTVKPAFSTEQARAETDKLQKYLQANLVFQYQNANTKPSPADISKWFTKSGHTYMLSDAAMRAGLGELARKLGVRAQNLTQAVLDTKAALAQGKPLQFTLIPFATTKTFTYCTSARDVPISNLNELRPRAQATLNDIRGWSLDGQIEFKEVSSGCDFTIWLSAANQMPSFGAICDSMWSCRVGPNVVINFDRWQNASPAWRQYGGSLEDYRHMVINHETGHWLGFGHSMCPGPGQPAPVMQQQSINLQGCAFNPWPTQTERDILRARFDL